MKTLLIFASLVYSVMAGTYFVAPNGKDTNSGTEAAPWLTISKAAAIMVAGDTVLVKQGVYRETVKPVNQGDASNGSIAYKAYPGDSVVISGTAIIPGPWNNAAVLSSIRLPDAANVWYVDVPAAWLVGLGESSYIYMDQLFEDGKRLTYAHWPDQPDPDNTYDSNAAYLVTGSTDGVSIIDNTHLVQADDFWNGAILKGIFCSGVGETHLYTITDYDSATHTITVDQTLRRNPPQAGEDTYAIMNHPWALDSPGEFYIDYANNRIFLMTTGQDDPNDHVIEISTRKWGFDLSYLNAGYVTIDGFDIKGFYSSGIHHYNLAEGDQSDLVIRNCTIHQNLGNGVMLDVGIAMSNTLIEGNRIYANDNKGLYMKCRSGSFDGMQIKDNVFDRDNNDDAIQISGQCTDVLFKGNYIGRHRSIKGHTDAIKMASGHLKNFTFEDNILVDNLMDWGTATYESLVFVNNVFAKGKHFHVRDRSVQGMVFINNTIYDPSTLAMFLGSQVTGVVFKNNIIDVRYHGLTWGGAQGERDHCYYMGTKPADAGANSFDGDSTVLVDPGNDDYRVAAGAAVIDAGTDVSAYGVTVDLTGMTRPNGAGWDIGAYEYYPEGIYNINNKIAPRTRFNPCWANPYSGSLEGFEVYTISGHRIYGPVTSGMVLVRIPGTGEYYKLTLHK